MTPNTISLTKEQEQILATGFYKEWRDRMKPYDKQDVFKSSTGKTVRLIFNKNNAQFPHDSRTGIIENITGNSIFLNVNGCLEIYGFEYIKIMYHLGL